MFVTTTVYCPPAFTVADAVVAPETIPGPDQLYETGVEVVVAITCAVKEAQVSVFVTEVFTTGSPELGTTCVVEDATHPLAGLVTVNV